MGLERFNIGGWGCWNALLHYTHPNIYRVLLMRLLGWELKHSIKILHLHIYMKIDVFLHECSTYSPSTLVTLMRPSFQISRDLTWCVKVHLMINVFAIRANRHNLFWHRWIVHIYTYSLYTLYYGWELSIEMLLRIHVSNRIIHYRDEIDGMHFNVLFSLMLNCNVIKFSWRTSKLDIHTHKFI